MPIGFGRDGGSGRGHAFGREGTGAPVRGVSAVVADRVLLHLLSTDSTNNVHENLPEALALGPARQAREPSSARPLI